MGFIQANSIFTKFLGVSMTDKEYMQIAIDISKTAKYPYGAIVVKDDKVIGRSDSLRVKNETCISMQNLLQSKML